MDRGQGPYPILAGELLRTPLALLLMLLPLLGGQQEFWERLPPPKQGEWLDLFPERGETFEEYRAAGPTRPTPARRTLYLLPALTRPPADREILAAVARQMSAHFGRETRLLPPSPLPVAAYDREARQYSVPLLVPALLKLLPDDGLFLLALTDRDLKLPKMTHVFGWGSFRLRVGVMSLARIPDDAARHRRRVLGLATHEAGHLLSMAHCTAYRCLMNGARTVEEGDRRPMLLCPVCSEKLCWNLGWEAKAHYRSVAGSFEEVGLGEEGELARRACDITASSTTG